MELFLIGMIVGFLLCVLIEAVWIGIQVLRCKIEDRKRFITYEAKRPFVVRKEGDTFVIDWKETDNGSD